MSRPAKQQHPQQPVMKLLNFGSSQQQHAAPAEDSSRNVSKMAKESFLQIFSEIHGEKMNAARFESIFQSAVNQNETVKALIEEINWEFNAYQQFNQQVDDAVCKVRDEVEMTRYPELKEEQKQQECSGVYLQELPSTYQVKLLIDGLLQGQADWSGAIIGGDRVDIGYVKSNGFYFDGEISEIEILGYSI